MDSDRELEGLELQPQSNPPKSSEGKNAFTSWKFKKFFTLKKERGERNLTVQCNLCLPVNNLLAASKDSTSNLRKHLKRKHPSALLQIPETSSDDSILSTPPPLKQTTFGTSTLSQRKLNGLVFEYIIADVQPFSLVENASFRKMIHGISGGKGPMSRKTLMQRIESEAQKMRATLTETLRDVQTVCTTADIWTAHHKSFFGVTCHWIEPETLQRKSAALACERLTGRHTYDVIAAKLAEIHSQFQIQGKVSATVTDNGSNFVKAFKEYGGNGSEDETDADEVQFADVSAVFEAEQDEEEQNFFLPPHHRCAAHTLNLIATSDLEKAASQGIHRKLYRSAMCKCAAIWNKAHRSSGAADAIEEIAQMRCLVPSVTRWSSEYHAIEKLMSLTDDQLGDICDRLGVSKLHPQEIAFLKEYITILQPLAYSVNLLQGEKNCFFGFIVPTIISLKAKLSEKMTQAQFSSHILAAVIKAIDTRFGEVLACHEARMAASTIPKFRLWWLADVAKEEMKRKMIQEAGLINSGGPSASHSTAATSANASTGKNLLEDDDNFFTFETAVTTSSSVEEEVHRYLHDPDKSLVSLKMYPTIKSLFIKYNTTLPSSAPVERLFSQGGLIFTPHRNRMSDKHFEMSLLLRYNHLYWTVD